MKPTTNPYRIVVPSHKRAENLHHLVKVLPPFTVACERSDVDAYQRVADLYPGHVDVHAIPAYQGSIGGIRDYVAWTTPERYVVMVDDDLKRLTCKVGQRLRHYQDPAVARAVLDNAHHVLEDLDGVLYAWDRRPTPLQFHAGDPVELRRGLATTVFMLRTRSYHFDRELNLGEDVDLCLQVVQHHRWWWSDTRWYWDVGSHWSGAGGLQTSRTREREDANRARIEARWGPYVRYKAQDGKSPSGGTKKNGYAVSIRVPSSNDLAIL